MSLSTCVNLKTVQRLGLSLNQNDWWALFFFTLRDDGGLEENVISVAMKARGWIQWYCVMCLQQVKTAKFALLLSSSEDNFVVV